MALIVAAMAGWFFPARVLGQDDEGDDGGGAEGAADSSGDSSGFDLNFDGWTVQDLMDKADQNRLAVLGVATALVLLFLWVVEVFKPGGLSKNGRDVKALPATVWLFGALVVFMASHMAHQMIGTLEWLTGPDPESIRGRGATDAATTVVLVLASAGIVYLLAKTAPKAALVPNVMAIPIGLLGLVLAAPVVMLASEVAVLVYQQTSGTTPDPIAHDTLDLILQNRGDPWVWGLIAGAVVGAPIAEEVVYRICLQSAVLRWLGSPWIAIIVSAGVFTTMHALPPHPLPPYALATIAVFGLSLGVAYERTRRVGVPMIMHMGFNAANIWLAMRTQG